MTKINSFDEANDEPLTAEENYAAGYAAYKRSPIRGWNVKNLHHNWIVTRQLVGHHPLPQMKVKLSVKASSTIILWKSLEAEFNSRQPFKIATQTSPEYGEYEWPHYRPGIYVTLMN